MAAAVAVALFLPLEFPAGEGQAQQQAAFEYEVLSGIRGDTRINYGWHSSTTGLSGGWEEGYALDLVPDYAVGKTPARESRPQVPGTRLSPVIELPSFDDRLVVDVVVDTCLNVREEHRLDAPIVTCLSNGAVAETDDFEHIWQSGTWMHIRTDDGIEGWAHADYLRWHSDGVRLEE